MCRIYSCMMTRCHFLCVIIFNLMVIFSLAIIFSPFFSFYNVVFLFFITFLLIVLYLVAEDEVGVQLSLCHWEAQGGLQGDYH